MVCRYAHASQQEDFMSWIIFQESLWCASRSLQLDVCLETAEHRASKVGPEREAQETQSTTSAGFSVTPSEPTNQCLLSTASFLFFQFVWPFLYCLWLKWHACTAEVAIVFRLGWLALKDFSTKCLLHQQQSSFSPMYRLLSWQTKHFNPKQINLLYCLTMVVGEISALFAVSVTYPRNSPFTSSSCQAQIPNLIAICTLGYGGPLLAIQLTTVLRIQDKFQDRFWNSSSGLQCSVSPCLFCCSSCLWRS